MKKIFLSAILASMMTAGMAQQIDRCGTMPNQQQHLQNNPQLSVDMAQAAANAKAWLQAHPEALQSNRGQRNSAPIITIPTVVHVVYTSAGENITDQQVYSQIAILNTDYRRLNADTINTPPIFDTIAADIGIEFCLASVDPSGNPTNGITRTSSTGGQFLGYFGPFDDVKATATGGIEPWPTDKYLNIWVCKLFPGLLGYAQFPGDSATTDGVVINYTAFGNMGSVTAPSLLGRTTTHEVGHWLGLFHIWGDDQDCSGSDSIPDTPNADQASSSDCQVNRNSCSNEDPYWGSIDPPDMVQNYMDYSHDSCMNMFTLMQKARMLSFLYGDPRRFALFNSPGGCNPLGIAQPVQHTYDQFFSVYPNPSAGDVYCSFFGMNKGVLQIDVIDQTGRTVKLLTSNAPSFSLDLSDLSAGVYSIRLQGSEGVAVKKIVRN